MADISRALYLYYQVVELFFEVLERTLDESYESVEISSDDDKAITTPEIDSDDTDQVAKRG